MTTIADVLNKASPPYKSHQIGKWHGGMSRSEQLPVNRGFQSSLGYLSGAEVRVRVRVKLSVRVKVRVRLRLRLRLRLRVKVHAAAAAIGM